MYFSLQRYFQNSYNAVKKKKKETVQGLTNVSQIVSRTVNLTCTFCFVCHTLQNPLYVFVSARIFIYKCFIIFSFKRLIFCSYKKREMTYIHIIPDFPWLKKKQEIHVCFYSSVFSIFNWLELYFRMCVIVPESVKGLHYTSNCFSAHLTSLLSLHWFYFIFLNHFTFIFNFFKKQATVYTYTHAKT